jgi:hypothetical protein
MKYLYPLFLIVSFLLYACTNNNQHKLDFYPKKMKEVNREKDIDWEQFQNDLKFVKEGKDLPLSYGVFPVSEYYSSGNGNVEKILKIDNNQFIQQSVFVYQGDYNANFFDGVDDQDQELAFFTLLVKTAHQDSANQIMSSSRNHPTYLAQGTIIDEKNQTIKWLASHNSDENKDMVIINMKYFNLTKGRLIIVYPLENGSLRFKQIDVQQKSLSELELIIQKQGGSWFNELNKRIENEVIFN